ncbi:MAG: hypothetical protein IPM06_19985 [Rhizobiales bacterium]|nr:hypothetical protein [Hyphomicrobiales bacterium]
MNVAIEPDVPEEETHDFHAFAGFTAPGGAPGQDVSHARKRDLDGWLAAHANPPAWLALYDDLLFEQSDRPKEERWDWRKCLYVAWRCLPAKLRWPANLAELASFMGLTNTATIRHWKIKDPTIERRIADLRVRLVDEHVSDLLQAAVDCGIGDGYQGHQDRKMLLEIAGIYRNKQEIAGELNVNSDDERAARLAAIFESARARRSRQDAGIGQSDVAPVGGSAKSGVPQPG